MKNYSKLFLIALIAIISLGATSCSKYKGFKKDKKAGFFYKFYSQDKKGVQPVDGDIVELMLTVRTDDSTIIPTFPTRDQIIESLFKGDFYDALRKMHVSDSASFIFNGDSIFHYYFGQEYPFGDKPLYFDIKLNNIIPKEDFEKQQNEKRQEYEAMLADYKVAEDSLLTDYIKKNKVTVKPTASGLYFIKTSSGKGKQATAGSTVSVHYKGMLIDGKEFDNSYQRGEPIELEVGKGMVIPGWDEALQLMKVGDKAKLIIPSKIGYGERGAGGVIPPYATLIFEVEMVNVK
ncbi:MAG TPA: FKBP-type peptidyl-prolyl cis-trans isomerase [Bacteroidales bacterium]|nr:FKBP-type peptidyl-prolyl cis-trans isomerase [Bacteroidales bacterium]